MKLRLGSPARSAVNAGSVDRPELLDAYAEFSAERSRRRETGKGIAPDGQ
ncbi:hypothetical protein [Streptomyces mirabilis]